MKFMKTVKAGYNAMADRYLAERTQAPKDDVLITNLIETLNLGAHVLDAG